MRVKDQTGFEVEVFSAKRVVSLVPSQTEFLVDIGLGDRLLGVTKFCIHPKNLIEDLGHIGGTKNLNIDKIRALQPDLIIGNKEENTKEQIELLRKEFPVWMSDIYTVNDALVMMRSLGMILDLEENTHKVIQEIKDAREAFDYSQKRSALYLIWKDPEMVVGSHSFIHAMLEEAGFENKGAELGSRYPEIELDALNEKPEFILLSTEPYPFKEKHVLEYAAKFPESNVCLVDGEMFSWYGSRMRLAYSYFQKLIS